MKNRTLDLWDKYSKCDKQTIVIVAVLVLSAKLCKADGHFSQVEINFHNNQIITN